MTRICASYGELFSNILKRFLLLLGKLAGYKGVALLVATVLLRKGCIGEGAWASVVISALCGAAVPKTFGQSLRGFGSIDNSNSNYEGEKNEMLIENSGGSYGSVPRASGAGRGAVTEGKRRIRAALERGGERPGD